MKKQTIPGKKSFSLLKFDFSEVTLILANVIPIVGIAFWNWSVFNILFLYWAESAVIGFYWIFKQIVSSIFTAVFTLKRNNVIGIVALIITTCVIITFFIFHFGMFMLGHLMAIAALTNSDVGRIILANEGDMLSNAINGIKILLPPLSGAIICLFISHGTSFFANFIGKKEYKKTEIGSTMLEPYKRIVLMQIVIIFGAILMALCNSPKALIVLLVILKILIDLRSHRREHRA
ncbi:MAG: DUF6498-containing protein [candidate division SR1 bacterium]|nr:DUF6498-containing protein [candidate division SR1 bacterium]